jgi:hypothetical protein
VCYPLLPSVLTSKWVLPTYSFLCFPVHMSVEVASVLPMCFLNLLSQMHFLSSQVLCLPEVVRNGFAHNTGDSISTNSSHPRVIISSQLLACLEPLSLSALRKSISAVYAHCFHNRSMNICHIMNLRLGGESRYSCVNFIYRTLCDRSETGGLN